jgi:hypothetical protein
VGKNLETRQIGIVSLPTLYGFDGGRAGDGHTFFMDGDKFFETALRDVPLTSAYISQPYTMVELY